MFCTKIKKKDKNQIPFVLLTHIHNQTGVIINLKKGVCLLKKACPQAFVHGDFVQSFGKYSMRGDLNGIDSVSVSSHKIGGPKGIAGLWLKDGNCIETYFHGGDQEFGKRSSTVAVPLIYGFGESLKYWIENRNRLEIKILNLNSLLKEGLKEINFNFEFSFEKSSVSPYILGMRFKTVSSDILIRLLEDQNAILSSSSACSSKSKKVNRALDVLKWDLKKQKSFLRISLGHNSEKDDIEQFIQVFDKVIKDNNHLF